MVSWWNLCIKLEAQCCDHAKVHAQDGDTIAANVHALELASRLVSAQCQKVADISLAQNGNLHAMAYFPNALLCKRGNSSIACHDICQQ